MIGNCHGWQQPWQRFKSCCVRCRKGIGTRRVPKVEGRNTFAKTCEWRIRQERGNIQGNLQGAERAITYARERVTEAERQLEWRKNELERALAERAKVVGRNDQHTKAITEHEGKLALIEAELAKFGVEW